MALDALLLVLALTLQAADGGLTCHRLRAGTHREINPVYGQSCARVIGIKAGVLIGTVQLPRTPRRLVLGALTVGGGLGVGFSLTVGK